MDKLNLEVVNIFHGDGFNTYITNDSVSIAYEYVKLWWDKEMPNDWILSEREKEEAVEDYFEYMDGKESCEMLTVEIPISQLKDILIDQGYSVIIEKVSGQCH